MKLNHFKNTFFIGFVMSVNLVLAQKIKTDSSFLKITPFKKNIKDRYTSRDFNYDVNDTDGINLLQKILRGFFGWMRDVFGLDLDINYELLEFLIYGIFALVILYLIIRLLINKNISSVFRTEEKQIEGFTFTEESITQINFDALISNAINEKNYRLATRYLYLKALKSLAERNIIKWHFDKTNLEYQNEIKDHHLKNVFKKASYLYDYVWYGEFPITETTFNENKAEFNALINAKING